MESPFVMSRHLTSPRRHRMRVTIMGATGLLGKALMREWTEDEITALGSRDVDIRVESQVKGHSREQARLDRSRRSLHGCRWLRNQS